MTTVRAGVRVGGESRGAEAALDKTRAAASKLNRSLGDVAGGAGRVALGVLGAGAAVEGLRKLVDLGRQSLAAYLSTNDDARTRFDSLNRSVTTLKASWAEAAIGGENLERITIAISGVVEALTANVRGNDSAMQSLAREGAAGAVQVIELLGKAGIRTAQGLILVERTVLSLRRAMGEAAEQVDQFGNPIPDLNSRIDELDSRLFQLDNSFQRVDLAADSALATIDRGPTLLQRMSAAFDDATTRALRNSSATRRVREQLSALERAVRTYGGEAIKLKDIEAAQAAAREIDAAKASSRQQAELQAEIARRQILDEKRAEFANREKERIDATRDKLAELAAARAEAAQREIEDLARAREASVRYVDGALAGLGRLAAGNDKVTKAVNAATGARLAGEAVYQLNKGIGDTISGNYATGLALIAQSAVSFAEAAKLGFSAFGGGRRGRRAPQTVNNINQSFTFTGAVDQRTQQGIASQVKEATRRGLTESAR